MSNLKIAILGYGKMGREIERLAIENNVEITDIFDLHNPLDENKDYEFDVAIEFTTPNVVMSNIEKLAKMKKSIVVGTTGWYDNADKVKKIVEDNNIGFIWGSNFSVGVQMYFRLLEYAAKLVNKVEEYDVFGNEIHHNMKKDSPSGTTQSIVKILLENIERKKEAEYETIHGEVDNSKLHFTSTRGGFVNGTHSVFFDSPADAIEINHIAKNRAGFASGSILAANWIKNNKGYYSFDEIIKSIWD